MSSISPSHESGSRTGVRPLTATRADGKTYTRPAEVEAEIEKTLPRPLDDWPCLAPGLKNETLVYMIRHLYHCNEEWQKRPPAGVPDYQIKGIIATNDERLGRIVHVLGKRTARIAKRLAEGFDDTTTRDIVQEVEGQIQDLILAQTPSLQSDFLEVAFAKQVQLRTIDMVRKHRSSRMDRRGTIAGPAPGEDADDEEIERPMELLVDGRPGPEALVLIRDLFQKACGAVEDPRHLEATILRCVYDWPFTEEDPSKPCLERRYNKNRRQIQNWITATLKVMAAAIGDKNDR
jgi:hypothetical protein